mgnify:FL=1
MRITPFHLLDKFVDWSFKRNGLELCYSTLGDYSLEYWISKSDKPVLVLLHAFGPNGKYSWRKQVRTLSKKYRLLIPNLVYFGNSTKKNNSYSINDQVIALKKLLEHLKISDILLGGTSYGGAIAFELLYNKSINIKKLFVTNAPVKYVINDGWNKIIKDFKAEKKSDVLIPDDYVKLKKLYDLTNYKKKHFPTFVFKPIFNTIYTHQTKERKRLIDTFEEDQKILKDRIYKTTIPVLLIWGEKDMLSPVETAKKLKAHLGDNARLEIIPNSGHVPHIEKTSIFNNILMDFLSA